MLAHLSIIQQLRDHKTDALRKDGLNFDLDLVDNKIAGHAIVEGVEPTFVGAAIGAAGAGTAYGGALELTEIGLTMAGVMAGEFALGGLMGGAVGAYFMYQGVTAYNHYKKNAKEDQSESANGCNAVPLANL
jgi:hypothetical protein